MSVSADAVKELREKTGCGIMECKQALKETAGDMSQAIDYLRKRGLASAAKKSGRAASEGLVTSYIHGGGKIGVLLEINCETDFVARTDDFQELCKEICMQIAAADPSYVGKEDVPADVIAKEKEIYQAQFADSGKPAQIVDKIIEGKLEKGFFAQVCLLEQPYIKEASCTVKDLIVQKIAKLGENIVVKRFTRYKLGA
ncbi:MAG: translation elongation factor Ts [Candidatus Schekmanbacteria bacterium]|nr:translation elongation factor Ts [Candidatus Schekmanbacteria bacterium]